MTNFVGATLAAATSGGTIAPPEGRRSVLDLSGRDDRCRHWVLVRRSVEGVAPKATTESSLAAARDHLIGARPPRDGRRVAIIISTTHHAAVAK